MLFPISAPRHSPHQVINFVIPVHNLNILVVSLNNLLVLFNSMQMESYVFVGNLLYPLSVLSQLFTLAVMFQFIYSTGDYSSNYKFWVVPRLCYEYSFLYLILSRQVQNFYFFNGSGRIQLWNHLGLVSF